MGVKALLKTNKAAAKRIRVRGSGSVKRCVLYNEVWLVSCRVLICYVVLMYVCDEIINDTQ